VVQIKTNAPRLKALPKSQLPPSVFSRNFWADLRS